GSGGEQKGTAEITVGLVNVNDAPEARHNSIRINEDYSHTFDVSDFRFRDAEHDDLKAVKITGLPENGTLYFNGEAVAPEQIEGGFSVTREDLECQRLEFRPDENFNGTVSFQYRIQDDGGTEHGGEDTSDVATMTVKVQSENDAPEIRLSEPRAFVVNTAEDLAEESNGFLSLRAALAMARDGDAILFGASLHDTTLILTEGTLQISKSVRIDASEVPGLTLASLSGESMLSIAAGASV